MPRAPARNPSRVRILAVVAVTLAVAAIAILRPWSQPVTEAPPPLREAEIAGMADAALVGRTFLDLQFHLVSPHEDPLAWRRLPTAAQHLFLIAYCDEQLRRERLIDLCVRIRNLGTAIRLDQLADAYAAIGLTGIAEPVRRAAVIAEASEEAIAASLERRRTNSGVDPSPDDPFAAVQGDLRRALAAATVIKPCAAYIRQHAEEVLAP